MANNLAGNAALPAPAGQWFDSARRMPLVRLPFFSVSLAGPPVLTGGKFGPEASVIAIAVCLAVAIVLLVLTVRNGRWLPIQRRTTQPAA